MYLFGEWKKFDWTLQCFCYHRPEYVTMSLILTCKIWTRFKRLTLSGLSLYSNWVHRIKMLLRFWLNEQNIFCILEWTKSNGGNELKFMNLKNVIYHKTISTVNTGKQFEEFQWNFKCTIYLMKRHPSGCWQGQCQITITSRMSVSQCWGHVSK